MERIGELKSVVDGPRWADFPGFLKDQCFLLGLDLDMEVDKRILTESVRFSIKGTESKLIEVKHRIESSIREYNK